MEVIRELLQALDSSSNLRRIPSPLKGRFIDLSGNDYLGFGADAAVLEEEFLDSRHGRPLLFTSSASRLLSVRQESHLAFEDELQNAYGRPALLFNSGYHANVGIIGSLASVPGTVFLADKLVHASIIDGLRLSGAPFYRFHHNNVASLKKLIEKHRNEAGRIVIVTESVFSMDGDIAPLAEIAEIKASDPKIMLYVDEAHAFGVFGPRGLGFTAMPQFRNLTDVTVGTFGKAGASAGAFAICGDDLKQWLVNTSRPFIFSTALPPANAEWSRFIFRKILNADDRRGRLANISLGFRQMIVALNNSFSPGLKNVPVSSSQIVPLMTGSSERAVALSTRLKEHGILALPIRRPTVPPGTERIRFSLHASLPEETVELTHKALKEAADSL